jgi:hypothetical protein
MPGPGGLPTDGESAPRDSDLSAAYAHCLRNREALSRGGRCGCFYCLAVFDAPEIGEWIGGRTAHCPRCGIDAVLSARAAPIDPAFLRRMRARWFERTVRWDPSGPWPPSEAP